MASERREAEERSGRRLRLRRAYKATGRARPSSQRTQYMAVDGRLALKMVLNLASEGRTTLRVMGKRILESWNCGRRSRQEQVGGHTLVIGQEGGHTLVIGREGGHTLVIGQEGGHTLVICTVCQYGWA